MRVLVTGASGFIGGILCGELLQQGHEVAALVRRPGPEPPGTTALVGDLRDGARLGEALGRPRFPMAQEGIADAVSRLGGST